MISLCSGFTFFHKACKEELKKVIQLGLEGQQKIRSLESQSVQLINQIQELKAVNDFQTWELEQKIIDLEKQLAVIVGNKSEKDDTNG